MTEADITDPKLLNLWKKAHLAREQKNWEYVVNLALPVVKAYPLFHEARFTVRLAEQEVAKTAKKGLFGGGMSMSFKSAKKDPLEAIWDLEENVFQKDPFNLKANLEFYELGIKAGHPDLAALGLETIRLGHPTNTKIAHQLAEHYMANDQPEKAGEVYRHIVKQDPRDMNAIKGEKDAAARNSIKSQWQGDFRSSLKDASEQNKLELINKQGMTREQMESLLGELSADYEADPTNITTVKNMANVLEKMEDFDARIRGAMTTVADSVGPDAIGVAFVHGGVIAEACWQIVEGKRLAFLGADNGSFTRTVRMPDGRWTLRSFNETAHLKD